MIVAVRSIGPLARALGGKRVEVDLPAPSDVASLLDRLRRDRPGAERFLRNAVQVFRGGRSLEGGAALSAGDEVHLVVAIAGG